MKKYIAYFMIGDEQVTIDYFDSLDEAKKCLEAQKKHDIQLGVERDYYGISIEEW
jgi:hypothetical protein